MTEKKVKTIALAAVLMVPLGMAMLMLGHGFAGWLLTFAGALSVAALGLRAVFKNSTKKS